MLQGKTALVTGSTSGIGMEMAKRFAAHGADIIINGLGTREQIEEEIAELETTYKRKVFFAGADLSKPEEIKEMFKEINKNFAGVDILVNNAGVQYVAPIEEFPEERWEAIIRINLISAFYTTREVMAHMRKKNWGRIINIASAHGKVGSVYKSAYIAAKHGLVGFTKTTALELATGHITCNAICPGFVNTPLVQKQLQDIARETGRTLKETEDEMLLEKHPSMRFVRPDQIAELALFLCSEAADSITGADLSIDGGWTCR